MLRAELVAEDCIEISTRATRWPLCSILLSLLSPDPAARFRRFELALLSGSERITPQSERRPRARARKALCSLLRTRAPRRALRRVPLIPDIGSYNSSIGRTFRSIETATSSRDISA